MASTFAERTRLTTELELLASWFAQRFARRGLEYDDAKQEALQAIWLASAGYEPLGKHSHIPFSAYARKQIIGRLQRALKSARARGVRNKPPGVSFVGLTAIEFASLDRAASGGELAGAVAEAMRSLDAVSQALILRRYGLDGAEPWSVIECANEFNSSVGSVKKQLALARGAIGAKLVEAGWDPSRWRRVVNPETVIKVG